MDQSQASFLDRLSCVLASNRNKRYPLWFEICSPQLESEVNPASMLWRRQKTISLDQIHRELANLGEQLSIKGSKDLFTAANRFPRSRRRLLVIIVAIDISTLVAGVFNGKYTLECASDENRKGKY